MDYSREPCTKGQVAIENLILYAVVLLIVAILVLVIGNLGILKAFFGLVDFIGFDQLVPYDWVVSKTDRVFLSLDCKGAAPLYVPRGGLNVTFPRIGCDLGPYDPKTQKLVNMTCWPGQKQIIMTTCPGLGGEYEIGEEFEMDVNINYSNTATKQDHMSAGKIYGRMEYVDADWEMPTSTTTTILQPPSCFNHPCNNSKYWTDEYGFDVKNCGEILYPRFERQCQYCPSDTQFPDGIARCWYNGQCGNACNVNKDCQKDPNPLNLCKVCVEGRCKEEPLYPSCGPCAPGDYGSLGSKWCNATSCAYCSRSWTVRGGADCDGYYDYSCKKPEDCGKPCTYTGRDTYTECKSRCPHCFQANEETPNIGQCTQGSCGDVCKSNDDCIKGCFSCNKTSCRCEIGDCGRRCGMPGDKPCELGCDVCDNNVCIHSDIGVSIFAHNGTTSPVVGKTVNPYQDITLEVTGIAAGGIDRILVSKGLKLPSRYRECKNIATERNAKGRTLDPYNDQFFTATGIEWMDSYACTGHPEECARIWNTSEADYGQYCYFALAQKYSADPDAEWSALATDYMKVGFIEVYLISPRPD